MSIGFYNEDVACPKIRRRATGEWIKGAIKDQGKKTGDISFVFCSDAYLLEINKKYLEHNYFTDIITFDYVEGERVSGDIFISVDRVHENAELFKTSFSDELNRIIIHGVLHLVGFKDKSAEEKKVMTDMEDFYLKILYDN